MSVSDEKKAPRGSMAAKGPLLAEPSTPDNKKVDLSALPAETLGQMLVDAATEGNMDQVDKLLLAGANVNHRTPKGYTALIKSCRMQRVEVVRKLLAYNPDVNAASNNGWTALIEACRVGHSGLAEELIAKGAVIDCINVMGWTPMIEACRNRHFHVIKMLVAKGSNVDHHDKDNMTPLDHTSRALTEIREFLKRSWREKFPEKWKIEQELRSKKQWPPKRDVPPGDLLADAALKGDIPALDRILKEHNCSIDDTTVNGAYTPLIFACRSQQFEMVRHLLDLGADVNKHSTAGWTPCIESSRVGNLNILKLLVARKGDINKTNAFGWHGLIEACRNVNYDVVEWSIENGSKVDHYDEDGECAMDHTTHPWIRGLLQGGPRNVLKKVLKETRDLAGTEKRSAAVTAKIASILEAEEKAATTASGGREATLDETMRALFEVIVQELDPSLVEPVLTFDTRYDFADAIRTSKVNIILAAVLLDVPKREDYMKRKKAAEAQHTTKKWRCVQVMEAILANVFHENSPTATEDREALVNAPDPSNARTAALECALKFAQAAESVTKSPDEARVSGLPHQCHFYFDLILFLTENGAKATTQDNTGASVLHYLMQTIPLLKDLGKPCAELLEIINAYLDATTKPEVPGRRNPKAISQEVLNTRVGQGEKTPLCYLVPANPHPLREVILMKLLRLGAMWFEPLDAHSKILEFEQVRLLSLVSAAMKDEEHGPENSWNIMVCAVRNGDSKLVRRIMQAHLPVYMTNPSNLANTPQPRSPVAEDADDGSLEATNVDALVDAAVREDTEAGDQGGSGYDGGYVPWKFAGRDKVKKNKAMGWARVDMSELQECLIHIAVEQETREDDNKAIFNQLLEYADTQQKTFKLASHELVEYPWPQGAGESLALTWMNSYGQNSFHVVANRKNANPSQLNTYYFKHLLERDVHATVTRLDESGWSSLHYSAYHNKPDIVNALIDTHIDLMTTTNTYMQHSALHLAALKGNWSITLALLEAGVDVDSIDKEGCTPLALAMLARQNLLTKEQASSNDDEDDYEGPKSVEVRAKRPSFSAPVEDRVTSKLNLGLREMERKSPVLLAPTKEESEEDKKDKRRQRSPEAQKLEALEREEQTYNFTIEALLNHGASIQTASEASGKALTKLMNVEERWIEVSQELNKIEELMASAEEEYFKKLEESEKEVDTNKGEDKTKFRKAAKELRERKLKVLDNLRLQVFQDKENQVVIEQKYDIQVRRSRFSKLVRFSLFLVSLIALGLMETTRNNHTAFYLQKSMADALSVNEVDDNPSFEAINLDREDFYKYARGAVMSIFYPEELDIYWHPKNHTEIPLARGVINHYNTMVGRPRFRQIRSRIVPCDVNQAFRSLPGASVCFTDVDEDSHSPFGPEGKYVWQSASRLQTPTKSGKLGEYPGSGFVVVLPEVDSPTAREEFAALIEELDKDNWVDAATRAIFLEFTLYNPTENHFLSGRQLVEFPLSGGGVTSWDMDVIPLRRYMTRDNALQLMMELLVLIFLLQHTYSEWVQFSQNSGDYFRSFYNWLDIVIVFLGPFTFMLQIASIANARSIDWQDRDDYINVERQIWYGRLQTNCYSVMVFAACLKLFDYLSVFRNLYRLIVMIEMMAKQLVSFVIVLGLFLMTFTVSEYIAYGYKDENSYSIQRGFLARVFGLFSGDPVVFGHTDSDQLLGTIYVMIFLITVSMVLMNLIVAVLTSAYDDARNQSSDVLAQRQYEKMNTMGLTKRYSIKFQSEEGVVIKTVFTTAAEQHFTALDKFDISVVNRVARIWERFENWIDRRRAHLHRVRKEQTIKKSPTQETIIVMPKGQTDTSSISPQAIARLSLATGTPGGSRMTLSQAVSAQERAGLSPTPKSPLKPGTAARLKSN